MRETGRMRMITADLLKAVVLIAALAGTALSAYAGRDSFMGGRTVFMFFTIQSNLALALIAAIGLSRRFSGKTFPDFWYVIRFVGAVSITLTGMVFCFVLAPTMGKYAWNIQNVLTHVVVPAAAVLEFFIGGLEHRIAMKKVFYVILPPVAYAVYAGIGYVCKWEFAEGVYYPYFFLNWGSKAGAFGFCDELPFMGCGWWILALLILLLLAGALYLMILNVLRSVFAR